jgi:hypothetical protein
MVEVTYERLDKVLRARGFSVRLLKHHEPPARVYEHAATGALIPLPLFPDSDEVLPRHLDAVRVVLDNYGLANSADFTLEISKSS